MNITTSIKGLDYQSNRPIEIVMRDGVINDVKDMADDEVRPNQIIAPGLIDIQINGYKRYDFNKKALTKEEWESVCNHLLKVGVTTFYPTVITNSNEKLAEIFEKNIEILNEVSLKHMIGGFHLEGPYISSVDGPRGAHNIEHIKPPDWKEFCMLQEKANGKIKIITLSPEWDGAIDFIKKAKDSGVAVAIGHTAATTEQIIEAVRAGAILSTHLGNGAHVSLPRHPNYIWDQLAEDDLWASVISDGHHLPNNVLHVFNKVKKDKMILVSDSVSLAGVEPGEYTTQVGGEVVLTENGRLHLKEEESLLAGSAQNLLKGIENLVNNNLTSRSEALNKASLYPAILMGSTQKAGLQIGAPADIVLIEEQDSTLRVVETYKNGVKQYEEESTWTT